MDQQKQPEPGEQRADRHHAMPAMAVDQQADARGDEPGSEQREREPSHGKCHRPAVLGRDQRHGQHGWIEDRAPGDDLGYSEHQNGAPGAGNDIAEGGHDGTVDEPTSDLIGIFAGAVSSEVCRR